MPHITQETLMRDYWYSPETGLFVRRHARSHARAATVSGWVMVNGYVGISVDGSQQYAHRMAWLYVNGVLPAQKLDHINGLRTDNRISNLREASDRVNGQNVRKPHCDNRTGFLGVTYRADEGVYMAQLASGGKRWRKRFKTAEDAHAYYVAKKREVHEGCTL